MYPAEYTNSRGYTAFVTEETQELVLYNSFDRQGRMLQMNNCLSADRFHATWDAKK
jgi:hypothetical protein